MLLMITYFNIKLNIKLNIKQLQNNSMKTTQKLQDNDIEKAKALNNTPDNKNLNNSFQEKDYTHNIFNTQINQLFSKRQPNTLDFYTEMHKILKEFNKNQNKNNSNEKKLIDNEDFKQYLIKIEQRIHKSIKSDKYILQLVSEFETINKIINQIERIDTKYDVDINRDTTTSKAKKVKREGSGSKSPEHVTQKPVFDNNEFNEDTMKVENNNKLENTLLEYATKNEELFEKNNQLQLEIKELVNKFEEDIHNKKEITELQSQLKDLTKQIQSQEQIIVENENKIKIMIIEFDELEDKHKLNVVNFQEKIKLIEDEKKLLDTEIENEKKENTELNQEIEKNKSLHKEQIKKSTEKVEILIEEIQISKNQSQMQKTKFEEELQIRERKISGEKEDLVKSKKLNQAYGINMKDLQKENEGLKGQIIKLQTEVASLTIKLDEQIKESIESKTKIQELEENLKEKNNLEKSIFNMSKQEKQEYMNLNLNFTEPLNSMIKDENNLFFSNTQNNFHSPQKSIYNVGNNDIKDDIYQEFYNQMVLFCKDNIDINNENEEKITPEKLLVILENKLKYFIEKITILEDENDKLKQSEDNKYVNTISENHIKKKLENLVTSEEIEKKIKDNIVNIDLQKQIEALLNKRIKIKKKNNPNIESIIKLEKDLKDLDFKNKNELLETEKEQLDIQMKELKKTGEEIDEEIKKSVNEYKINATTIQEKKQQLTKLKAKGGEAIEEVKKLELEIKQLEDKNNQIIISLKEMENKKENLAKEFSNIEKKLCNNMLLILVIKLENNLFYQEIRYQKLENTNQQLEEQYKQLIEKQENTNQQQQELQAQNETLENKNQEIIQQQKLENTNQQLEEQYKQLIEKQENTNQQLIQQQEKKNQQLQQELENTNLELKKTNQQLQAQNETLENTNQQLQQQELIQLQNQELKDENQKLIQENKNQQEINKLNNTNQQLIQQQEKKNQEIIQQQQAQNETLIQELENINQELENTNQKLIQQQELENTNQKLKTIYKIIGLTFVIENCYILYCKYINNNIDNGAINNNIDNGVINNKIGAINNNIDNGAINNNIDNSPINNNIDNSPINNNIDDIIVNNEIKNIEINDVSKFNTILLNLVIPIVLIGSTLVYNRKIIKTKISQIIKNKDFMMPYSLLINLNILNLLQNLI